MTQPRVMLCTLALNEMEWLPHLWEQHKDWPGLCCWCFVEGADAEYAKANPDMVQCNGDSVDGTTEFLTQLSHENGSSGVPMVYLHCGIADVGDSGQNKVLLRDAYLRVAEDVKPDVLVILDGDEFYSKADQARVPQLMMAYDPICSFVFHRREIWRPPSLRDRGSPLMEWEVKGGFWDIPCCHWWRWRPGMCHRQNHNTPEVQGRLMNQNCKRIDRLPGMPQLIHFGFAAAPREREAKRRYYEGRGEATDPKRMWYVESRAAWLDWQPGDPLPRGARVVEYSGPEIECFKGEK